MFGYNDPEHAERDKIKLLARAGLKHGGQPSVWFVGQQIKKVCQKHDVADLVTIEPAKGNGLKLIIAEKAAARLGGRWEIKWVNFNDALDVAVSDCAYKSIKCEGYYEIHKV